MELDSLFDLFGKFEFSPRTYQYFHQLIDNRTILFNADVDESIVESVYLPLKEFEEDDSTKPVTLILNSCGGSVSDGFFLAHYIAQYKKQLKIIVPGYAASMAAVILAGGGNNPNVTRYCFPSTYGLIHDGYIAISPSESKTAADIMTFNEDKDKEIQDFIISHTKITEEEYTAQARRQWFLTAKDMLERGLVDKIIGDDDNNENTSVS